MESREIVSTSGLPQVPRLVQVSEHSRVPLNRGELLDLQTGSLLLSPHVIGSGYIRVQADKDQVVIHAGPYIGLIPLNDYVTLEIVPRVPISNLVRILAASGRAPQRLPESLRTYATQAVPVGQIRDELANAFIRQVQLIGASGLHYIYETRKEDTSFPRGRILLNETITRLLAKGKRYLISTARFERNINTSPNQLLKLALLVLASTYQTSNKNGLVTKQLGAIRDCLAVFSGVTTLATHNLRLSTVFSKLPPTREYYLPALELAQLILGIRGLDFDSNEGNVSLPSLLWKMDDIFEDYVRWGLRQHLLEALPKYEVADGNVDQQQGGGGKRLFVNGPDFRMANPDIVIMEVDMHALRRPVAVFDVKYKPKKPERDDLNQILAYAMSYQVPVVGIISLAEMGKPSKLTFMGEIGMAKVYHYALQLGNNDLASEEAAITEVLLSLIA
ncbi:5-methylcytosine-specific restriction enzyme subunit McrC [Hymenobacter actinosclerus]|uniref:5-methylcytosine-specific restriction enzyme subunit McrC n=1 Tax=Hymenobacter actinosclerus TaxID=82805 RepID=A0A1I0IME2_9BACT|nr:5-methylcytosine-specific restriction enzyme subunit McrC [Hymenobacter actinosclerus]